MTTIPLATIEAHAPCVVQFELARRIWPDGVPLTEEALDVALAHGIDLGWAERLLSSAGVAEFVALDAAAGEAFAAACVGLDVDRDPAYVAAREAWRLARGRALLAGLLVTFGGAS